MAVISPPAWLQAGSYPARTDRLSAVTSQLFYAGFAADEATPLRPRQGVRPSYQQYQLKARAAATPNMTVIVSGGMGFVDNHDINGYGTYVLVNDGDVTLTVAAAGGAGQFRKDSVCFSVYDAETAGAANTAVLEIIQGPYASSAGATVRGTIPPNALVLADLAIAPSQTSVSNSNITDVRNFTASLGGIASIPSTIAIARPHPGQVWYEPDLDRFRYGDSTGAVKNLAPDWQNYTPAWTGLTTLGSAVSTGRYCIHGKTVHFVAQLKWGTSSSLGTGNISVSLPTTPAGPPTVGDTDWGWQGTGRMKDGGAGGPWKPVVPVMFGSTTTATVFALRQSDVGWVSPGTGGLQWISGASMRVQGSYETA